VQGNQATKRVERLQMFREVAVERISRLNLLWIEFEQTTGDPSPFLREVHTLKGEASLMGFVHVSRLIHAVETFVKALRDSHLQLKELDGDLVLAGLDLTQTATEGDAEATIPGLDLYLERLLARRNDLLSKMAPSISASPTALIESASDDMDSPRIGEQRMLGSTLNSWPMLNEDDGGQESGSAFGRRDRLVRVTTDKIDRLRDMVSDLLLSSVRWRRFTREIRQLRELASLNQKTVGLTTSSDANQSWAGILTSLANLESQVRDETHDLERLITELDGTTRDLRMMPLSTLFDRFPLLLRQVARSLGRHVRFEKVGEQIEVDKAMLELLEEPLLHVLRNAVDHGVEPPEIRAQRGKPVDALVRIHAGMVGQRLHLTISDDGAGIEIESVRTRAVESGILNAAFAKAATNEQILRTLFVAGFSTRTHASEISGRGMGLNIVLDVIENIGGRISVETTLGQGTTFHMDVPLTVVITRVVLFRVGLGSYALPAGSVVTLVVALPEDVVVNPEGRFLRLYGRLVPLVDLTSVLGEPAHGRKEDRIIVVQNGSDWVALVGSYGHSEREVVLKPLGRFLERHPLVSAAVVLEEGAHALVLKGVELIRISRSHIVRTVPVADRDASNMDGRVAVVVDDSPIVREVIAQILRSHGLHVLEASDGEEALSLFNMQNQVDVVVTDMDMPRLDGIGLLRSLRACEGGKDLPIVALSMRGSAHEKQVAMEAGMSAYIDKSDFNQALLWQTIRPFILRS
jgi:chemotaxis protein histidine kinase CheA